MQKKYISYILAGLGLIIAGLLAYFITGFFVKPKTVTIDTTKGLASQKVKDLQPTEISITSFKTYIEVTFNTASKTFAYVYITFDPEEKFTDVLKLLKEGEAQSYAGMWYKQQESTPSTKHTVHIPLKDLPAGKANAYMYLLLEWGNYYIPYGEQTSPVTGPLTAWTISLNNNK